MGSQAFTYALIAYFVLVAIFVGILGQGGVLADSDVVVSTNPNIHTGGAMVLQSTSYLIPGVPVCIANGSINFEEPDTLLFTFNPANVTLSTECTSYCRNESSFFINGLSCPGLCANITDFAGVEHIGCAPEDNDFTFLTSIVGFFIFGIDLGLGAWMWIIRLIFVYIPLLFLGLSILYGLRGT